MNRRLLVILLLLVFLPLALLIGMGRRVAHGERERAERKLEIWIAERLTGVDSRLQLFMAERERDLLALTASLPPDPESIRDRVRADARLACAFRLSPAGELVYPVAAADFPLTEAEAAFLRRTDLLWKNRELWHQAGKAREAGPEASAVQTAPPLADFGWYPWHFEHGLHLLFWRRLDSGEIVGAELNRARLMSDLLAGLPDTSLSTEAAPERTALLDAGGLPLYQWGAYEPGAAERPRVTIEVSPPLNSWRLAWYGPPAAALGAQTGADLATWAAVSAFALMLGLMAVYFYRESSRELREAAQRVNFVGQVSHELKTPLTNIRMYAELLENQLDDEDAEARRDLEVIVSESRRLSRLIGNILTFSRKDRESLRLRPSLGNLDDAVRETVEIFRPLLEGTGVEIRLDLAGGEAVFDRDLVEQIVGNLLSNVEKYGASGGRLTVGTSRKNGASTIVVADEGPGVPPGERENIFRPFYRISDRLTDGVAGTGLGLSLSRDLARLHGGDLKLVDSEKGARFELTLADLPAPGSEKS